MWRASIFLRLCAVVIFLACARGAVLSAQSGVASSTRFPDTARYSLKGTVINSVTGEPVNRALVVIYVQEQRGVFTDREGHFQFDGVPHVQTAVGARKPGFLEGQQSQRSMRQPVVDVGPDTAPITLKLTPEAVISGRVYDENGEPLEHVPIRMGGFRIMNGRKQWQQASGASTDFEGEFRIANQQPGEYYLSAGPAGNRSLSQIGSATAVSVYPVIYFPDAGELLAAAPIQLAAGQHFQADFSLKPSPVGTSSSYDAALDVAYPLTYYLGATDPESARPIVLQAGEQATADMTLTAVPALHLQITNLTGDGSQNVQASLVQHIMGGVETPVQSQTMRRIPDALEISGIAPGPYEVNLMTFSPKGGRPQSVHLQSVDLGSDTELDSAKASPATTVSGIITFEGRKDPAQRTFIQFRNRDSGSFNGGGVSAESGEIDPVTLAPGIYDIIVQSNGFLMKGVTAVGAKISGQTIKVGSTPVQLTIAMSKGVGRIDGVVLRDGKPAAGAMVVLVPQNPANQLQLFRRDQSDSDGTFTLAQVLPGKYTVVAIDNGWSLEWSKPAVIGPYLTNGEVVQVEANGKLDIKVKLQ